jgi:hypothetical protein
MSEKKAGIQVTLTGTGINENFLAMSHEIMGLPAGTYHKFLLEDGTFLYYNDFGLRTVLIRRQ